MGGGYPHAGSDSWTDGKLSLENELSADISVRYDIIFNIIALFTKYLMIVSHLISPTPPRKFSLQPINLF